MQITLCSFSIVFLFFDSCFCQQEHKLKQLNHQPKLMKSEEVEYWALLNDRYHFNSILNQILIPRVVGTPNHEKVLNAIVNELKSSKWNVEIDEFRQNTPIFGKLTFKNIIGRLNPNADRYLVLACHYDSKYFKNVKFVGAIDSAVPCSMMLNLVKVLSYELEAVRDNQDLSLALLFLDGEEAFQTWNNYDSIYGAKHLAELLQKRRNSTQSGEIVSDLERIDVFVLLDLLGARNPRFQSFFKNTDKWYRRLHKIEETCAALGLLENWNGHYFRMERGFGGIEDDHIPFLQKGVPILHIIPSRFPREWHTANDNKNIIDADTVDHLNKILRIFVAEYLHLSRS